MMGHQGSRRGYLNDSGDWRGRSPPVWRFLATFGAARITINEGNELDCRQSSCPTNQLRTSTGSRNASGVCREKSSLSNFQVIFIFSLHSLAFPVLVKRQAREPFPLLSLTPSFFH